MYLEQITYFDVFDNNKFYQNTIKLLVRITIVNNKQGQKI
jgi:hypothetical protein